MAEALTQTDLQGALKLVARGKVRDLYEIDDKTLLFVATDRISAYDVIMENGIPNKGKLLTLCTKSWFQILQQAIPNLRTHFITLDLPPQIPESQRAALQNRSMQVRKYEIFKVEAIVRGYITGSAWNEYQKSAAEIVGAEYAPKIASLALNLYKTAHAYAYARGLIIADTKFEFGLDRATNEIVLVDEVLTPDSSRFWPKDRYVVGQTQESFDKQYLRDWLTSQGLKGKEGVKMTEEVALKTAEKYREAWEIITGGGEL
ncbi:uncharacterized protein BHQ10_009138 [Talaromyces amestolkiae]|uniref:Phosphoribosylaminoimidazole-succinocarboxamide synthase n=1 Tax=Talaromyces amestolkiae TaxID=1196081 RepID=A0A364LBC9_TALAM|nr:uncharacterized protein BHQ10_009138 [Talaromyces amestolkiae]RAO73126.1 hypothetical protein BHQ10_009138 [Talaromyces amestolkiae]